MLALYNVFDKRALETNDPEFQRDYDAVEALSLAEKRKAEGKFGRAIHGMGTTVLGFKPNSSLMSDLNSHMEFSTLKKTSL